jgi:hypothetical protein
MTRKTKKARRRTPRRPAPTTTGSVVKADFRARYAEHGGSSGDELSVRLRKHLETDDGTIDLAKLRALAETNDVWSERYAGLNAGMQRLNVGNRLRALVRRGGKIKWGASR